MKKCTKGTYEGNYHKPFSYCIYTHQMMVGPNLAHRSLVLVISSVQLLQIHKNIPEEQLKP